MATFYASGEFPSFKPIRIPASSLLAKINEKLPSLTDNKVKDELIELQARLGQVPADKEIYLTIEIADQVGII